MTHSSGSATAAARPSAAQPRLASDKESAVKKSSKLISLDNIHEITQKKQQAEEEELNGTGPLIREFNEENVIQIWADYADSIREAKGGTASIMDGVRPMVTDATISLLFSSDLQRSRFNDILPAFKAYIHRRVGFNPHIIVDVTQQAETAQKFFTPKDKLERLMELNPALRRFHKELGLDLDYD
ncbi:MAG: hypothetical protein JSS76_14820 [Bacteroidetes bacterium]|nr:hypothetical protein [Bacteroidota bacterium]MBS1686017.1 hypothetical protein [Bacteroidota bacterium]